MRARHKGRRRVRRREREKKGDKTFTEDGNGRNTIV